MNVLQQLHAEAEGKCCPHEDWWHYLDNGFRICAFGMAGYDLELVCQCEESETDENREHVG